MIKNCLSIDRVNLVPQRSQRKGDQREISQTLRGDSLLLHFGHCIGGTILTEKVYVVFERCPAIRIRSAFNFMKPPASF